jgi:hypothetical protein
VSQGGAPCTPPPSTPKGETTPFDLKRALTANVIRTECRANPDRYSLSSDVSAQPATMFARLMRSISSLLAMCASIGRGRGGVRADSVVPPDGDGQRAVLADVHAGCLHGEVAELLDRAPHPAADSRWRRGDDGPRQLGDVVVFLGLLPLMG